MQQKAADWKNKLRSPFDGNLKTDCHVYESCEYRSVGQDCLDQNIRYAGRLCKFIDSDFLISPPDIKIFSKLNFCIANNRIFELVRMLAQRFRYEADINQIPVSVDFVRQPCCFLPVEVRLVPLKTTHGAVWRLDGTWIIHLNSRDSPARRRFTLYHELFHVLAYCDANPVFRRFAYHASPEEGLFNELLADHFSAVMTMPGEAVRKKWAEVRDIRKMASVFGVPEPVMYGSLHFLHLI